MKNVTDTLGIGSRAPEFRLAAANQPGEFALSEMLTRGSVGVEFLRGTW